MYKEADMNTKLHIYNTDTKTESAPMESNGKTEQIKKRYEEIIRMVREQGFVTIDALAQQFGMTPQTIRRDINVLSQEGRLQRYHGGAGLPSSTENVEYSRRQALCFTEKQCIARVLAQHIPNQSSLFINIGTTNEEIAKALSNHSRLRVITNNLNVAAILSGNRNFEVIVTGGLVRSRDGGIIGEATVDFIRQFRVDYGIIGISGIDEDGTLLDFDYREVNAAKAIIANSRKVFLAADHTKFGRNAMVRLGSIDDIDALFTDRQPSAAMTELMSLSGTELYVAENRSDNCR